MKNHLLFAALAAMTALSAAVAQTPQGRSLPSPVGKFVELASPAPDGAAQPNLTSDRQGRVWLSWLEPRPGGGHRFRLASLKGTTWSAAQTIAEGSNFLANWADFPSVFVSSDGTMAAHWLERGSSRGSYGIRLRTSTDGGRTWTAPVTPHRDKTETEHGFVSFFDAPGAGLGLIWLDGREMAGGHGAGMRGSMTVRAAMIGKGQPGDEMMVDPRVCECCQTSAARTADGVIVAYRDRTDAEIRDISVARFSGGKWSSPATVHADNWNISGCPVNGPVVTAIDTSVAVAWLTAAAGAPRTQVAFSTDGGQRFERPIQLNINAVYGRLAVVMPAADRALITSIERGESGAELTLREARRDGRASEPTVVTPTTSDRSSGFARMALSGRRLIVAWTDVQPGPALRVKVAAADLQ